MATAGVTHHIVLNGVGYMLRPTADGLVYRRSETPYLVPRRADAVGRSALARPGVDNGGFAAGVQAAFGRGGYARGEGIDARAGDGLRVAARLQAASGLAARVLAWAEFNGTAYAGAAAGSKLRVYKYNAATNAFTELNGSAADGARLVATANSLWVVPSSGAPVVVNTSDGATSASGANASGLVDLTRTGTRLIGVSAAGATRSVRWAGLGGDVAASTVFTAAYEDGDPREPSAGIAALGEDIYLAKRDGLYRVTLGAGDTVTLARVVDHTARRDAANFGALAVFRDALYYTVRDRLYRFDGRSEADVSPPATMVGAAGAATTRYVVKALGAGSGWLWALTESDEATAAVHVWAYDGGRWEQLVRLAQAAGAQAGGLHASPSANGLLVNYHDGSAWTTARMDLRATSDLPAASFNTSGAYAYLAPLDGGLPDVTKRFHSVALRGSGLAADTAVHVDYWDGSGWIALGSLTAATGGELLFPDVVTGRALLLRLDLRSDGTRTPLVGEVGVGYDILPGPAWRVTFEAVLAPNLRQLDGTLETATPTALLQNLDTCRGAGAVVTLVDPVQSAGGGGALQVRVAEVGVRALVPTPDGDGQYGWLAEVVCDVVSGE